ncbi:hypothetical protein GCM10022627_36480 [Haloarcula argentinensis]
MSGHASSGAGISRRTIGVVIIIGLFVFIGGMVVSGALPGLDSTPLAGTSDPAAEGGVPDEAFGPEVNSTALRQAHADRLNEAGSFTFTEEYSAESTSSDAPSSDETLTATFDLESDQSLIEILTADFRRAAYGTGTESYERIELPSQEPQYRVPDRDIGPDPYLDSGLLGELETMETEHRETETGHVYTASGVDAVSDGFLDADVDSFRSFEFEAVVSDQGVLKEFSYRVVLEDGGEVITVTRSGEITDIGSTQVREPGWLDDARAATS